MEMIRFENVYKEYAHNITGLADVSLVINKGGFAFLCGPSGAGKTTIMRLVFSAEKPTSGRIFISEEEITDISLRQVPYLRRHIGMVFQDFRLLTDRTIFDNLNLILLVLGIPSAERKRRCLSVLSQVGLAHRRNAYPLQLSGGEQQRIAIARAIIADPLILLADEPTGNLDPDTSWDILQTLRQINARGTTVVVATHNYGLVRRLHAKLFYLRKGRLLPKEEYPQILYHEGETMEEEVVLPTLESTPPEKSILAKDSVPKAINYQGGFEPPPPPPDAR